MERYRLFHGDCLEKLKELADDSVDSIVTDPPYHLQSIVSRFKKTSVDDDNKTGERAKTRADGYARLAVGFMGQEWDGGDIAFKPDVWLECLRVLKPGGHLVAFGGTRTYHRMTVAIEDAGFEIRDQIGWLYGTGFPKSHNVGNGWGTALKPAWEPIVLARKPLIENTVAENVMEYGTGAINIDGCRVEANDNPVKWEKPRGGIWQTKPEDKAQLIVSDKGRWPANVIHDGSEEVVSCFPSINGSASRFFYSAKASDEDREFDNDHPTVKPNALMRYLCKLITPVGGTVLDPFMGSGSTGKAALQEEFNFIGIEREEKYFKVAEKKVHSGLPTSNSLFD